MDTESPKNKKQQEPKILTKLEKLNEYLPDAEAMKNMALGALLLLMGYFIASLEMAKYVIGSLIGLAIVFFMGVVYGKNLFNKTLENAQDNWEDNLKTTQSTSKKLVVQLLDFRKNPPKDAQTAVNDVGETLQPLQPILKKGLTLGAAFVTRIWAFSSLMGVLAFAVSLAICVATFMQVQLLDTQNAKLDVQNALLRQQDSLLVEQNGLFNDQNRKVERQIDLMDEQNTFIEKQLVQIDTQNFFIGKQIEQGYIQNLLVRYQNRKIDVQTSLIEHQNSRLDQQTYLQEAGRRSSLVFLFSNIMDAIDKELKDDYGQDSIRNLSPQLIGRIIALSTRLKPYQYLDGDTLIGKPLSPERGQLLVSLVESQLDSNTYGQIFWKGRFEFAVLKEINLEDANLIGVDLKDANLERADLIWANLKGANLRGVNLKEACLVWARLEWAYLKNAYLREANLERANLYKANLKRANLYKTNLKFADLRGADLRGAKLRDVKTLNTLFFKTLEQNVKIVAYLEHDYLVDPSPQYEEWDKRKKHPYYLIKRKEKK